VVGLLHRKTKPKIFHFLDLRAGSQQLSRILCQFFNRAKFWVIGANLQGRFWAAVFRRYSKVCGVVGVSSLVFGKVRDKSRIL
jgi:hypothetical protein